MPPRSRHSRHRSRQRSRHRSRHPSRHRSRHRSRRSSQSSRSSRIRWVDIDPYLSSKHSRGPDERKEFGSEFTSFESYDTDILTLSFILRQSPDLQKVACIAPWRICMLGSVADPEEIVMQQPVSPSFCPPPLFGYRPQGDLQGGLLVTGLVSGRPQLWVPDGFERGLLDCRGRGVRFVVCNLGVHETRSISSGHANGLIFDVRDSRIERYDPQTRKVAWEVDIHDQIIGRLFLHRLPGWKYVGTQQAAPKRPVQRLETDSYDGMCQTFAFWWTLLRILNPDRTSREVQQYMLRGTAREIRSKSLRLNRFMADSLRSVRRGTLRYTA